MFQWQEVVGNWSGERVSACQQDQQDRGHMTVDLYGKG